MRALAFLLAVLLAAVAFALAEVQIEGRNGWAAALPTWRIDNRWTRILMGGRPLTGYHLYVHLFLLILLHVPFALEMSEPTLPREMRIFAFLILFWVAEDFLYFVFNPAFGLRRFSKQHIPWHPHWWWILPREYWIFAPLGIALYGASSHLAG
ncbi:MAG TPA: hypothetical protein VGN17_17605 [Bryobacteraceae bacterium]|jgi:hypothetical protein